LGILGKELTQLLSEKIGREGATPQLNSAPELPFFCQAMLACSIIFLQVGGWRVGVCNNGAQCNLYVYCVAMSLPVSGRRVDPPALN